MSILEKEQRLIIFGDLKNFIDKDHNLKSVKQFILESLANASGMDKADFSQDVINYHLHSGSCVILLDALDEVCEDKRNEVQRTLLGYFCNENPNNEICITSRSRGFIGHNHTAEIYQIQPLIPKQIEDYINNFIKLGLFNKNDKNDFLKKSKPLMEKGFLSSCLVLSLLVSIFKAERALPDK